MLKDVEQAPGDFLQVPLFQALDQPLGVRPQLWPGFVPGPVEGGGGEGEEGLAQDNPAGGQGGQGCFPIDLVCIGPA